MGRFKQKEQKAKRESLNQAEQQAIRLANGRGLYVLFSGTVGGRRWRIYDRRTGCLVGTYFPHHNRLAYHIGPLQAVRVIEPDHTRVMQLARERANGYAPT